MQQRTMLRSFTAFAIAFTMMNCVAFAQTGSGTSGINGVAVNGNTTTVFEAANDRDLQMHLLTKWSGFAQQHQKIAHQLGDKPALMGDASYLRKHPDLAKLFGDNPDLLSAMRRDPGNFVANQPKSEE
jgi:hypothetical protein